MKNKSRGFGTEEMILGICLFIIGLLIVAFMMPTSEIYKRNIPEEKNTSKKYEINYNYYYKLEEKMNEATRKYISDNNINLIIGELEFSLSDLSREGYIKELKDNNTKNKCDGYSVVVFNDNNYETINSYIKCDEYTTEGYDK